MQTKSRFIESILSVSLSSCISMDNSKLTSNRKSQTLPSFFVVRFPVWNTRIQHSHSHYYTSYPLPIPYTPKSNEKHKITFTLFSLQTIPLFSSSYSKYYSFHSFPITIHSIAKTQWKLFSISFSFTRFNACFSSAALSAGVDSASLSHWWVLWVFWVVFSTLHPNSIMNTLRRFGAAVRSIFPLLAVTLAGRFRLDAFTSNLCKSRRTTRNQSTENPKGRQGGSRAWSHCDKSSLQSEYHWFSANRNTLCPICANFPFFASNWIS